MSRETPLPNAYPNGNCFFCGPANPVGPRLSFSLLEDDPPAIVCRWTPPKAYSGLGGILHGGIQAGLFDEMMGWTTHQLVGPGVTTGMEIEYLGPLYVEKELTAICRVAGLNPPKVLLAAHLQDQDGTVRARAKGTYRLVKPEVFKAITGVAPYVSPLAPWPQAKP